MQSTCSLCKGVNKQAKSGCVADKQNRVFPDEAHLVRHLLVYRGKALCHVLFHGVSFGMALQDSTTVSETLHRLPIEFLGDGLQKHAFEDPACCRVKHDCSCIREAYGAIAI